jgi:tryptophan halogenase
MEVFQQTDVLEPVAGYRILQLEDGGLLVGNSQDIRHFVKPTASAALAIMSVVDGRKTVAEVCEAVASEADRSSAIEILKQLLTCAVRIRRSCPEPDFTIDDPLAKGLPKVKVVLVGNGRLADWLKGHLTMFANVSKADLPTLRAGNGSAQTIGIQAQDQSSELHLDFENTDMVVAALEGTAYKVIHSLNSACLRTGTSFLPILLESGGVTVGPTITQGNGVCLMSAVASLMQHRPHHLELPQLVSFLEAEHTSTLQESSWSEAALLRLGLIVCGEIRQLGTQGMSPHLLVSMVRISEGGEVIRKSIHDSTHCAICDSSISAAQVLPIRKAELETAHLQAQIVDVMRCEGERMSQLPTDNVIRTIGVIGGGTAGYLTALALQRVHPQVQVTLIESSSVPIIGVGEATTPLMPAFLHGLLAFPVAEFFREVKPTFKLGIKFVWGAPGDEFDYPFGDFALLEPHAYENKIVHHSLYSQLMASNRFPLAQLDNRRYVPFLRPHTAYHLDNVRFVNYLSKKARNRNITSIDALIGDVETILSTDGVPEISALRLADGRRLSFDLYVDCTGFRSILLGKALRTKFISYEQSLFTDQAIVADVPHGGGLKPYTLAETMNSGWCWNIPQVESDHRGYVFSSAFCTVDDALQEMRQKNPAMGDHWAVKFRSGRHEEFWRGNVVAMGNAYAFVEPLESTALHMVLTQIRLFLDALPIRNGERGIQRRLSRRVADHWDYIRWFLAIHYRFNRRLNTPFWRACREQTDVSARAELLQYYKERGPLSYYRGAPRVFGIPDAIWGPQGIDMILMGQKVPSRTPLPATNERIWKERLHRQRAIVASCVSQEEALGVLEEDSSILSAFVDEAVSRRQAH